MLSSHRNDMLPPRIQRGSDDDVDCLTDNDEIDADYVAFRKRLLAKTS